MAKENESYFKDETRKLSEEVIRPGRDIEIERAEKTDALRKPMDIERKKKSPLSFREYVEMNCDDRGIREKAISFHEKKESQAPVEYKLLFSAYLKSGRAG